MIKKIICFDMDGTIADLYAVPDWLAKLRADDPSPYRDAAPMWDMTRLREILLKLSAEGWEIRVISWLSKDSTEEYKDAVRMAKMGWLLNFDFPMDACHLVAYGTTKADCIRRYHEDGDNFILIDDNSKVRNGWHMGETIDPMDGDLLERLEGLLKNNF